MKRNAAGFVAPSSHLYKVIHCEIKSEDKKNVIYEHLLPHIKTM